MTPEIKLARDCFLSMIAEARTWRENVDGDIDNNGRTVMYIDYDMNVRHSDLEELANVLGIENAWDETIKDAIDRELALPDGGHVPAQSAPGCVLAPMVHVPNDETQPIRQPEQVSSDTTGAVTQDKRQ